MSRRDVLKLLAPVPGGGVMACGEIEPRVRGTVGSAQSPATPRASGAVADTLFVNGRVATMDPADTVVQAVAIKEGLILSTGSNDALHVLAGPGTR